jgi:hypothetical protein
VYGTKKLKKLPRFKALYSHKEREREREKATEEFGVTVTL